MSSFYGNCGIISNNEGSSNSNIPILTVSIVANEISDSIRLDQTANMLYSSFCNGLVYVLTVNEEFENTNIVQELITKISVSFDNENSMTYFEIDCMGMTFVAMNGDDYPSYSSDITQT